MQAVIIALLCVINLVLWLVFFLKFKKLFSTDDVIQKTRDQYELLLSDVNRNALSNIDLIQMKIDELQALIDVADRRLSTINSEELFLAQKKQVSTDRRIEKAYGKKNAKTDNVASEVVEQNQAFELDFDLKKVKRKSQTVTQTPEKTSVRKRNVKTNVEPSNLSESENYIQQKEMPRIYMSANPIQSQKTFQDQVKKLYEAGYSVDDIAHELNKSTTEVELIVEML